MASHNTIAFAQLLQTAVTEPGIVSSAYSHFHNYSLGNLLLAVAQCEERGIPFGPIATYARWKELRRHVKRGEHALTLCQPVVIKRAGNEAGAAERDVLVRFMMRARWFVMAQTDGEPLAPIVTPAWSQADALEALKVEQVPFESINGNAMGYARGRTVAISPLNPLPHKTLFHELGHVLLGHTAKADHLDGDAVPKNLSEVEAEAVALLCCEALGLPGAEYCRGYIQDWWKSGEPIPEHSAQRILRTADQILKAGYPAVGEEE